MKDKNHMIIFVDAEKAFDKIQHVFMIKTLNKVGIETTYLNMIKVICDKVPANITLNGQKTKSVSLKIGKKAGMFTSITLIQHSPGNPSQRQEEEMKGIQIGKEEVKLSLFSDDMIVYIENPTASTKKILDLISECGKTAGHKVNIEKLKTYLYTKTEISEVETRKIIPFAIATRKN